LGSVLVVSECYLDGKEKIDSRFRGCVVNNYI